MKKYTKKLHYTREEINYRFIKINHKVSLYKQLIENALNSRFSDNIIQGTYKTTKPISVATFLQKNHHITGQDIKIETIKQFDPEFWNDMLVYMDSYFDDRDHKIEGNDGNVLNEVRLIRNSILHYQGVLESDPKIVPDNNITILKIQPGEKIMLSDSDFINLRHNFQIEIEKRYKNS